MWISCGYLVDNRIFSARLDSASDILYNDRMTTSTTATAFYRAYSLFSNLFGLRPIYTKPEDTDLKSTDTCYTVRVFHAGKKNPDYFTVFTSDNPAIIAAKFAEVNENWCDTKSRMWISEDKGSNGALFRFRLMRKDGQPVVRLIDPRSR